MGDGGNTPGHATELLLHRRQIRGADLARGGHLTGGVAVDGFTGTGTLTGAFTEPSAITIDCHSWPYHGPLFAEPAVGAAIFGPSGLAGVGSASITV
ncbi:MAG: hypothetical protein ABIZ34_07930 [Candidatus Limnocylindrales bacterium]